MASNSILLEKSLKFAARIVKLYQYLIKQKHETIFFKANYTQRHVNRCKC